VLLPSFLQVVLFWAWSNFVLAIRLHDLKKDEFTTSSGGEPDTDE